MTWKCSQTLWDYEFFTEKIANFKERKLRIYINFNLKNQIYFFSLVRRLYWSDVCTGPTFVLVRRLYWSDVCTGPTFVLVRRMYCPTFVSLRFVPSDVCGSDVCTSTGYTAPSKFQGFIADLVLFSIPFLRFHVQSDLEMWLRTV